MHEIANLIKILFTRSQIRPNKVVTVGWAPMDDNERAKETTVPSTQSVQNQQLDHTIPIRLQAFEKAPWSNQPQTTPNYKFKQLNHQTKPSNNEQFKISQHHDQTHQNHPNSLPLFHYNTSSPIQFVLSSFSTIILPVQYSNTFILSLSQPNRNHTPQTPIKSKITLLSQHNTHNPKQSHR